MRAWPAVVAACAVAASAGALADGKKLSGAELKDLLAGAVAYGFTIEDAPYIVSFEADGTAMISVEPDVTDSGAWAVYDDRYCSRWDNLRNLSGGEETCFNVIDHGDGDYHFIAVDEAGRTQDIVIEK